MKIVRHEPRRPGLTASVISLGSGVSHGVEEEVVEALSSSHVDRHGGRSKVPPSATLGSVTLWMVVSLRQ